MGKEIGEWEMEELVPEWGWRKEKREVISAGVRTCQYISTCLVFSPVLTLLNEPIPISGAAAGTIAT